MNSLLRCSRIALQQLPSRTAGPARMITQSFPRGLASDSSGHGSQENKSLYELLGVNQDANQAEIKSAFYELSKLYHPDVTKDKVARAKFFEIAEAYEVLGNPRLKHNYDRGLFVPRPGIVYTDSGATQDMPRRDTLHGGVEKRHRVYKEPPGGYSAMYDFDDFYKTHYRQRLTQLRAQEHGANVPMHDHLKKTVHRYIIYICLLGVPVAAYLKHFISQFGKKTPTILEQIEANAAKAALPK